MIEYLKFFFFQLISKTAKMIFEILPVFIMSAAAYGNYVYLLSVAIIATSLATLGMPISLLRLVPEWKKNKPERNISFAVWDLYFLSFIVTSFCLIFFLAEKYDPIIIMSFIVFIFFYGAINLFPNIFRALMQIKKWFFYQEVLTPVISNLIILTLLIKFYQTDAVTLQHMLLTMTASALITTIFMYKNLKAFHGNVIKIRSPFNKESIDVFKVSLPLLFTSFTYLLLSRIDVIMLKNYIQSDTLGIYNIVARVSFQALFVWQIITSYYMPKISKAFIEEDTSRVKKMHRRYLALSLIPTLLLSLLFIIIINLYNMNNQNDLWNHELLLSAYILLVAQIFSVIFSGYGYILVYIHKEKFSYINSMVMIFCAVTANMLFIPEYGVVGASLATLLAIVVVKLMEFTEVFIVKRELYI